MTTMRKIILTLLGVMALLPALATNNVAPWGWATCSDESGTAYTLSGGNFANAKTITLKALGSGQTDDKQIKLALAQYDIIVFDGSNGDFTIEAVMKLSTSNKTLIGINDARLCTQFYLTEEDIQYLKDQKLDGLSSTEQYTGTLPDGTTVTCDKRAFFTKKAMMELQYQKTGVYTLPNKAGIFHIDTSAENIIIRNLSLIGPGSVDIDGSDLITNQGKHIWIDHCTLVDSQDGALDSKVCDWSTYTFNHFYYTSRSYSHAYTCGCGWVSDHAMVIHMTFASNLWGKGCMRRLPQCDDSYIHLVNNYHNCPGNSVGMTINSYTRALVENNYAASGVNKPLTGEGSNRHVTARGNSFNATSVGNEVSVPYPYTKIAAADVPDNLTGTEGAGATLGNDADYILSTIPSATHEATGNTVYVMQKDDIHIGNSITEIDGITVTFDPSVTDWRSGGSGNDAQTVDGIELTGYYTQSNATNKAPINITTTKAGTLTIIFGGGISKAINMTEGDNGLTGSVLSTGAMVESGTAPATPIAQWDGIKYDLEANKTYVFSCSGTKWRLAALRYISSTTGITTLPATAAKTGKFYNLQGNEVITPTKGLYICNGKKIIIQ